MTMANVGPGTPEHFLAVGGQGDEVLHPVTSEVLRNSQTGALIIQEHPRVAAQAAIDAAQVRVDEAQASLEAAQGKLAETQAELANADARYTEIVAHLVEQQAQSPTPESEG